MLFNRQHHMVAKHMDSVHKLLCVKLSFIITVWPGVRCFTSLFLSFPQV